MSVKLTNFVKININRHVSSAISSSMDTAVLLKFIEASATPTVYDTFTSYVSGHDDGLDEYLKIFFNNGGLKLKVIEVKYTPATVSPAANAKYTTSTLTNVEFAELIESVTTGNDNVNSNIVVGYMNTVYSTTPATYHQMTEAVFSAEANTYNSAADGLYKKIFIGRIDFTGIAAYTTTIENYICKVGAAGIEASVMAYLTRIDSYKASTISDYAFTQESFTGLTEASYVTSNNDYVEKVISKNLNCDSKLVGEKIVNIGGNDTKGNELVNQYVLILLHRTLTTRLINLLQTKIKLNGMGLASVLSACTQELNKYSASGYLNNEKIWTDNDLYYNDTLIIANGTALPSGYKVVIMPISSLTPAQKQAHQLPDIYLLLADSYSIRKIVITGEVF